MMFLSNTGPVILSEAKNPSLVGLVTDTSLRSE
jgi:hypothetical protein